MPMHAPLGMKHHQSTSFSTLHLLLCLLHLSAPHTYPGGERANNVLLGPRQHAATNETETILSSHSLLAELNAAISIFGSGSKCFLLLVKLLSKAMETYGNPFWWSEFCMKDSQEPSLKAFSQINRPVLLLILTLPRQFQNIEHSKYIYIYIT